MLRTATLFMALLALAPLPAWSGVDITTATSTVRQILRYTDESSFAQVLLVEVEDPANVNTCRGAWLNNSDRQFRDVLQMALTAKATGLRIRLHGDPARLYPGSSDRYCYLEFIGVN